MGVFLPVAGVLTNCVGCMMLVEQLVKKEPGSMNLMTFSTFLFIAIEGLIVSQDFLRRKNQIPISGYLKLVVIFFVVNVVNNQALNFHVPVPLHIIFRSGSLLASLVLGVVLLRRQYSTKKYISVALITIGIIVCTLATSTSSSSGEDTESHLAAYTMGIIMLTFALIASAYLGVTQERLYAKYGKHSREALFYVHALSLPGFAFMWNDIYKNILIFNQSTPWTLPVIGVQVPEMWVYLLMSDVAQYGCIRCVYILTSEVTSLTVTLVVTLRKFLSLIISIVYFQNPFTLFHWLGTILVFAGTLLFSDINWQKQKEKIKTK